MTAEGRGRRGGVREGSRKTMEFEEEKKSRRC